MLGMISGKRKRGHQKLQLLDPIKTQHQPEHKTIKRSHTRLENVQRILCDSQRESQRIRQDCADSISGLVLPSVSKRGLQIDLISLG